METVWEFERLKLFQIVREHPDWSSTRLAEAAGHSLSWVKKWRQRFRQAKNLSLDLFQSQSRAPRTHAKQLLPVVRNAILSLRDQLKDVYKRTVGSKTILYHLHRHSLLQQQAAFIPHSASTIWRILKEGGRIPTRIREHHPVNGPLQWSIGRWILGNSQIKSSF